MKNNSLKKFSATFLKVLVSLYLFLPLIDTFFISVKVSEFYILLFALWAISSWLFNVSYATSFSLSGFYLFLCWLYLAADNNFAANRFSVWFYLFFGLGLCSYILEQLISTKRVRLQISPIASLLSLLNTLIFKNKISFALITLYIIVQTVFDLIYQLKYFYWFYTFNKFQNYVSTTGIYHLLAFIFLTSLFIMLLLQRKLRFRLLLLTYLSLLLATERYIYTSTTSSMVIRGLYPVVTEIKVEDGQIYLFGHNFGHTVEEFSWVKIDEQTVPIVEWQHEKIIVKTTGNEQINSTLQLSNSSRLESNKIKLSESQ